MGQYQARSKSVDEDVPVSTDVDETTQSSSVVTDVPPIFGSPIHNGFRLMELPTPQQQTTIPAKEISYSISPTRDGPVKEEEQRIPIVFRWDGGGNEVYVCGSFNHWETKIPMTNSHGDFTAIVDLPQGKHEYKFYVDGQWIHNPNEPVSDNHLGSFNNVVDVNQKDFDVYGENWEFGKRDKAGHQASPPGSYCQDMPPRSAASSFPPHLPPLLQQTALNEDLPSLDDPTLLPDPSHVSLNHLYALSIKDNVLVLGATHRYKEKYVTTLMYKPVWQQ
ncbi:hypothetical protein EMCRGX_G023043 [Ephydatia muelleri]|eukprot:Em0017g573a